MATTESKISVNDTTNANDNPNKKQKEHNPRWKGYVFITITSLINLCSISTVNEDIKLESAYWAATLVFGLVTFTLALLVLLQDRVCIDLFHYQKIKNGKLEAGTLTFMTVWWIVGVGIQTKAGGIAYVANNIYYSSWSCLASCMYTLNEWSASKDILSLKELTGLSLTLKSWYVCLLSSLVVLFTSVDLYVQLDGTQLDNASTGIGIAVFSCIISAFFILVHYQFFVEIEEGGWLELSSSFFLILLWTIALAVLTQDEGIGATVTGSQCFRDSLFQDLSDMINCTITVMNQEGRTSERSCMELLQQPGAIPGSNLYFSTWICYLSSLNVTFHWKAAQALQFAQAQEERQQQLGLHESDDENDEVDSVEGFLGLPQVIVK